MVMGSGLALNALRNVSSAFLRFGDVHKCFFVYRGRAALALHQVCAAQEPYLASVLPPEALLVVGEALYSLKYGDESISIFGLEVSIGDGTGDEFFAGGVAEDPRAGEIAFQDSSVQRRADNPRQTPFV